MALVMCRECGKEISDQAFTCPSCGALGELWAKRLERYWRIVKRVSLVTAVFFIALLLIALIIFFFIRPSF